MVKVCNWIEMKEPPQSVSVNDMRFGIGCMVDIMYTLADRMATLLHNVGKYEEYNSDRIMAEFETSTFGYQMKILRDSYNGVEISDKKLEELRRKRNHFAHDYTTGNLSDSDGKKMYDLINLIKTVQNQLNNANNVVSKQLKKKNNQQGHQERNALKNAISKCKMVERKYVLLADVGNQLKKTGCQIKNLKETIEGYGWELGYLKYGDKKSYYLICKSVK